MPEQTHEELQPANDAWAAAIAKRIADGHAFTKHGSEFPNFSREQFMVKIQQTIQNPSHDEDEARPYALLE